MGDFQEGANDTRVGPKLKGIFVQKMIDSGVDLDRFLYISALGLVESNLVADGFRAGGRQW
jgi:hypothetical protein